MAELVYIVEDNEDIGYILDLFLSEEGFNVTLCSTVDDFRMKIKNHIPDIFLFDVMLPDGNGIDLCNELKSNVKFKHVPVIIMSANTPAEKVAENSLADSFIKKPFDLNLIQHTLTKYLRPL